LPVGRKQTGSKKTRPYGVCGVLIAQKLGVSHPTVSEHLKILAEAGLIRGKRIKQWTFYRRDEPRIRELKSRFLAKI